MYPRRGLKGAERTGGGGGAKQTGSCEYGMKTSRERGAEGLM